MHDKFKKVIISALVVAMMLPIGNITGSTDDENNTKVTTSSSKELPAKITDEQALKTCKKAAEAGKLELWYDDQNNRVCLLDKTASQPSYWWSSPINVLADDTSLGVTSRGNSYMKDTQRQQLNSGLAVEYGDQAKRTTSPLYSAVASSTRKVCETSMKPTSNGVAVTYTFRDGFTIPVEYTLNEGSLTLSCDTTKIVENNTSAEDGKVLTKIQLAPSFGAAPAADLNGKKVEGYMIVPDGSGAVIEYNNGKSNYASSYSQPVYGRDYTTVPLTAPRTTEQAYMPVFATVTGNKGLVAVATSGDSNVTVNAQVSGQNNQTYNNVYFEFEVRSSDDFYLSGETNPLKVFQKGDIAQEKIAVTYYPISGENNVNYADCAKVYRNYLIENKGLTSKVKENQADLYIDLYGGVKMQKSILGIPFNLKTSVTSFNQAQTILQKLQDNGATDIIANYNDWTDKSIDKKISTSADPSGTLGGEDDFNDLMSYADSNGIKIYPALDNMQMESSSWGYWTFTSTATRVSNAYSRQTQYNPAFGAATDIAPALLTPTVYSKVFDEIVSSYKEEGLKNISFGGYSSKLVSDFSVKNFSGREDTMNTIIEGYKNANKDVGSVLADGANSYILPYVDHITNIPVNSSGFNVVDYDIPFYQMVVHGYVPYSTQAINKSSNSEETFLLALAYGSSLHYDMLYEHSSRLSDTDYGDLYYANYEGWLETAAAESKIAKQVLSAVSKKVITKFDIDRQSNVITTTYGSEDGKADESIVKVDLQNGKVSIDGTDVDVSEIIKEGGLQG